jgi:glutamate synthase domain-containing protein 2
MDRSLKKCGADVVTIGTTALLACACRQHRLCATGTFPVGAAARDPDLRKPPEFDIPARKIDSVPAAGK